MEHRSKLATVPVYAQTSQKKVLDAAAKKENRSTSNFLLNLGLQRAKELGFEVPGYHTQRITEIVQDFGGEVGEDSEAKPRLLKDSQES